VRVSSVRIKRLNLACSTTKGLGWDIAGKTAHGLRRHWKKRKEVGKKCRSSYIKSTAEVKKRRSGSRRAGRKQN
jgi:hypothetical protein